MCGRGRPVNPGTPHLPTSCDARGELTPRVLEVLRAMATGRTYAQTGEALFVSRRTVQFHLKCAYRVLGVHNLQSALLAAGIVRIVEEPQDGAGKGQGDNHGKLA